MYQIVVKEKILNFCELDLICKFNYNIKWEKVFESLNHAICLTFTPNSKDGNAIIGRLHKKT